MQELKQYREVWAKHHDKRKRGPVNWQELTEFAPAGLQQSLEAKGYQFVWPVDWASMVEGSMNSPLAYPDVAATTGGLVVLADGTVHQVTAVEFGQKYKETIDKLQGRKEWLTARYGPWLADDTPLTPGDMVNVLRGGDWIAFEVVRIQNAKTVVVRVPSLVGGAPDQETSLPRYSIRMPPANPPAND